MIDNTDIINEIITHMNSFGGEFSKWYCGITEDGRRRLFDEHNVSEDSGIYIAKTATDKTAAEMIEKYFLDQGCQGAPGGGNENSRIVYAYRITNTTKE